MLLMRTVSFLALAEATLASPRTRHSHPYCGKWLGKKWCCTGGDDANACYLEQESACDEDNAVTCTVLAEGTGKACCPKLTTCDNSAAASEGFVRCNINRRDLLMADAARSTSSTAETSSSTPLDTDLPLATNSGIQINLSTRSDEKRSTGITGTAIGGIVVGAVAAVVVLMALLIWLVRRKEEQQPVTFQFSPPPSIVEYYPDPRTQQRVSAFMGVKSASYESSSTQATEHAMQAQSPAELMDPQSAVELMDHQRPAELEASGVKAS